MNTKQLLTLTFFFSLVFTYSQSKITLQEIKQFNKKMVEIRKVKDSLRNYLLKSQQDSIREHNSLLNDNKKSKDVMKIKLKLAFDKRSFLRNKISELENLEKEFISILKVIKN